MHSPLSVHSLIDYYIRHTCSIVRYCRSLLSCSFIVFQPLWTNSFKNYLICAPFLPCNKVSCWRMQIINVVLQAHKPVFILRTSLAALDVHHLYSLPSHKTPFLRLSYVPLIMCTKKASSRTLIHTDQLKKRKKQTSFKPMDLLIMSNEGD